MSEWMAWKTPFASGRGLAPFRTACLAMHPSATMLTRSWQVAYVWAFIVKFGLLPRISSLLNLEE